MTQKAASTCFLLVLISFTCVVKSEENPDVKADWTDFQTRHILNPTIPEEENYKNWERAEWNDFLKQRIGGEYGIKRTNSFIVGKNTTILADFEDGYYQYTKHDGVMGAAGIVASNLHWGTSKFEVYVLNITTKALPGGSVSVDYDVYDCSDQYVLAGFDETNKLNVKPVHYEAQSTSRRTTGKINLELSDCEPVSVKTDENHSAKLSGTGFFVILLSALLLLKNFY